MEKIQVKLSPVQSLGYVSLVHFIIQSVEFGDIDTIIPFTCELFKVVGDEIIHKNKAYVVIGVFCVEGTK